MPFSGYEVVSIGEPIAPLYFIPGRSLALHTWSTGDKTGRSHEMLFDVTRR
jgi:hypothetical protein